MEHTPHFWHHDEEFIEPDRCQATEAAPAAGCHVITGEQAKQAADAVLSPARAAREEAAARQTRTLVRLYPALKRVQPTRRRSMHVQAKAAAAGHWTSRLVQVLLAIAFIALVWFDSSSQSAAARICGWLAAVLFLAWQLQWQFYVRKHLRAPERL